MYYFASDIHLGLKVGRRTLRASGCSSAGSTKCLRMPRRFFWWAIVFDFWYEYRRVVPKGFTRLLGKLSELTDRGVAVHFFPVTTTSGRSTTCRPSAGWYCTEPITKFPALAGKRVSSDTAMCSASGGAGTAAEPGVSQPGDPVGLSRHSSIRMRRCVSAIGGSGSNRKAKPIRHAFRGAEEPIVRFASDFLERTSGDRPVRLRAYSLRGRSFRSRAAAGSHSSASGSDRPTYGKLDQKRIYAEQLSDNIITTCNNISTCSAISRPAAP